jgi:hypothetical protein
VYGDLAVYWWNAEREPPPPRGLSIGGGARGDAQVWEIVDYLDSPHTWPEAKSDWWGARVIVPSWVLLAPAVFVTAVLWWRDRRRIPPGHCQKCGYNLTGNVSGVCPECGTAVAQTRGRGDTVTRGRGEAVTRRRGEMATR